MHRVVKLRCYNGYVACFPKLDESYRRTLNSSCSLPVPIWTLIPAILPKFVLFKFKFQYVVFLGVQSISPTRGTSKYSYFEVARKWHNEQSLDLENTRCELNQILSLYRHTHIQNIRFATISRIQNTAFCFILPIQRFID